MTVSHKITNQEVFDAKVIDIDTSGLKCGPANYKGEVTMFRGDLEIELEGERSWRTISGDINQNQSEWGFKLIAK